MFVAEIHIVLIQSDFFGRVCAQPRVKGEIGFINFAHEACYRAILQTPA